jgi:hypothetical protein
MLLLANVEAAIACSRTDTPPTEEELFAKASTVFVGHLVRVDEAGVFGMSELRTFAKLPPEVAVESLPPIPAVEATFRVVEVFRDSRRPMARSGRRLATTALARCSGSARTTCSFCTRAISFARRTT